MMVAELDHRVKNVLATVSALTSRTQDAGGSVADFVAALDGRIQSMAATHQLLSSQQWRGLLLSDLARRELAPYATNDNTEIDGPDVTLKAEAAQAVSMVLHELATNAAKHGALSTPDGRVAVRWYRLQNGDADARLCVEWQETGGPAVRAPGRCGYGMEVIRGLLPYELDGKVDLAFAAEGVRCRFDIPLSELTGGDAAVRSGFVAEPSTLLRSAPPLIPTSVLPPPVGAACGLSLHAAQCTRGRDGDEVLAPYESLVELRAAYMPDAARSGLFLPKADHPWLNSRSESCW
jgi:two-component sensor histidine kinase